MIHEFTMANGLKVIGVESHKSPVVSVQMWVRNGSADERSGDEGLSHFIEHLVFKGSRKYQVGEIASLVESCGGELNAYTSFDQTVFYVTISKAFFGKALDVISEMVGHPQFDAQEIDNEREVVIEEIKRSQDNLSRRASQILFSSLYPNYPYAVPVIGYDKVIREIPRERIVSFFHERYVPRNMFLVVTGDFKPEDLRSHVEKHFADLKDEPVRLPERPAVTSITERIVQVKTAPFEEAIMNIAWPTVDIRHPDVPALECLSLIFGQGASSRLTSSLRLKEAVVNYVGAGLWAPATKGFMSVSAGLNPKNFERLMTILKEETEILLKDGVTDEELQKAKVNFLSEDAYSLETVGGLARKYGSNFDLAHDVNFHVEYYRRLDQVTVEDVIRVAREYMNPQKMLITAVVPESAKNVEPLLQSWTFQTASTSTTKTIQKQKLEHGIEKLKTKNGLPIFLRKSSGSPVFHLRWASLGGARVLKPEQAGLSELVSRLWATETKKMSEQILRSKIDSLASSVYAFSGRNTLGLVVDGLSQFQKPLAELFHEVLLNWKISESSLEREKHMILESLRSRKDSPAYIASLNFHQAMFANHPYAMDQLGTEETLKNINVTDIEEYLQQYIKNGSSVVAICGDYYENLWTETLEDCSQRLPQGSADVKTIPHQGPTENSFLFETAKKEQTHLIYGFKALSMMDKDRHALQIMEAILAGQGGRLFLELRDKASLAYSVSPMRMEGMETGYFGAYIGCSPEKTETALQMMNVEFQKLTNDLVGDEELRRAKNYLLGGHDIGLQKNSSVAASMAFNEVYGLPAQEAFEFAQQIEPVTAQDIQRVAREIFSRKSVISVVGPRKPDWSQP